MRFSKLLEETEQAMALSWDEYPARFSSENELMSGPEFYSAERKRLGNLEIALGDIMPFRFKETDGGPFSHIDANVTAEQCGQLRAVLMPQLKSAQLILQTQFSEAYDTMISPGQLVAFENGSGLVFGEVADVFDPIILGSGFSLTFDRAKAYDLEHYVCNMEKDGAVVDLAPCAVYQYGYLVAAGISVENIEGVLLNVKFQVGGRKELFTVHELKDPRYNACRIVPARKKKMFESTGPYR